MTTGFAGLGLMGEPIAANLVKAGKELLVWNRTADKCRGLVALGAQAAEDLEHLFQASSELILMLKDAEAIDEVLDRHGPEFQARVLGKTIIQSGTVRPSYSERLGQDIEKAGGRYVEAPVSGSRGPAENGELVVMLAGDEARATETARLLEPVYAKAFFCGPPPNALQMKLAVNHFLITMVSSLCESFNFARRAGLDVELFRSILDAGPMASAVSRAKLAKLATGDFSPQASLEDVLKNADLVFEANMDKGAYNPLLANSRELVRESLRVAGPDQDMAAILAAFTEARLAQQRSEQ